MAKRAILPDYIWRDTPDSLSLECYGAIDDRYVGSISHWVDDRTREHVYWTATNTNIDDPRPAFHGVFDTEEEARASLEAWDRSRGKP